MEIKASQLIPRWGRRILIVPKQQKSLPHMANEKLHSQMFVVLCQKLKRSAGKLTVDHTYLLFPTYLCNLHQQKL